MSAGASQNGTPSGQPADPVASGGRASALRRQFDASFAMAAAESAAERLDGVLAIRLGQDPYALRLTEILGLHADRNIVPVPSPVAALLGIVGLRGKMAPVYDLGVLLGYPPVAQSPRWMIVADAPPSAGAVGLFVGLAFEVFEAHVRVPPAAFAQSEAAEKPGGGAPRQHLRGTVHAAGMLRPLIQMASVMETIRGNKR